MGVLLHVDYDILDTDIAALISSTSTVIEAPRFGTSQSVKIVFLCNCLTATVKLNFVRHPIRWYVPRPLQFRNLVKFGHVAAAFPLQEKCDPCCLDHKATHYQLQEPKCLNGLGNYEPISKHCPRMRKQIEVRRQMAKKN